MGEVMDPMCQLLLWLEENVKKKKNVDTFWNLNIEIGPLIKTN